MGSILDGVTTNPSLIKNRDEISKKWFEKSQVFVRVLFPRR